MGSNLRRYSQLQHDAIQRQGAALIAKAYALAQANTTDPPYLTSSTAWYLFDPARPTQENRPMTMIVDLALTEDVREHLAAEGKVLVWKSVSLRPSVHRGEYTPRSSYITSFRWRAGWNEPLVQRPPDTPAPPKAPWWRLPPWRKPPATLTRQRTLTQGQLLEAGVLHAFLYHAPDDLELARVAAMNPDGANRFTPELRIPLVGHAADFVAAGWAELGSPVLLPREPHVAFRRLWMDQAVYDRLAKGNLDCSDLAVVR